MKNPHPSIGGFLTATAAVAALLAAGCRKADSPTTQEVLVVPAAELPEDPEDAAWSRAPEHVATLLLQDLVEPRLLAPSTPEVRVRALSDGSRVAFRLEWVDETLDDLPGAARFSDACAVQVPASVAADVPAPQMGEPGKPVEIALWRASWQATVDGRGDSITDLFPNATVDHYPFEAASLEKGSAAQREMAALYAPARSLGNAMAGPRASPIEDLIADGPGTLRQAEKQVSKGRGKRTEGGWAATIVRPLPDGLGANTGTQVAFALWEGSREESGARKMRTGWIPLAMEAKP